ncbi:8218_t:CDS:2, partial [Ambispora gerdemannii]
LTSRTDTKVGLSDPAANTSQEITSTEVFGTSMSTHRILELGLERRETVWSLSVVGVGNLRRSALSTRGPEWTDQWCTSCPVKGTAG